MKKISAIALDFDVVLVMMVFYIIAASFLIIEIAVVAVVIIEVVVMSVSCKSAQINQTLQPKASQL